MPDQPFDVEGARKEGYSDQEIAQHLAQTRQFDLNGALKEGYSVQDIIDHLRGQTSAQENALLGPHPKGPLDYLTDVPKTLFKDATSLGPQLMADPVGTVKGMIDYPSAEQGRTAIPIVGPMMDAAVDAYNRGEYGQAAAHMIELASGLKGLREGVAGAFPEQEGDLPNVDLAGERAAMLKGGVKGLFSTRPSLSRAAPAAVMSHALGFGYEPGAVLSLTADAAKNIWKGARNALEARRAAGLPDIAPELAQGEDAAMLEGISQSQLGKAFAKATPDEQATIRMIASRIASPTELPQTLVQRPTGPIKINTEPESGVPKKSMSDLIDEEIAARKAKKSPITLNPAEIAPAATQPVAAAPPGSPMAKIAANPEALRAAQELQQGMGNTAGTPNAPPPRGTVPQARYVRDQNAQVLAKTLKENAELNYIDPAKLAPTLNDQKWGVIATMAKHMYGADVNLPTSRKALINLRDTLVGATK